MANNLFQALEDAGFEVVTNPTPGDGQAQYTVYVRNQATDHNHALTITKKPDNQSSIINTTIVAKNNPTMVDDLAPGVETPSAVNMCLAAPLAISCANALGSSGDLELTGNWDVIVNSVKVQNNVTSDAVRNYFVNSGLFMVSDLPAGNDFQCWISSSGNDLGGDPNNVDINWMVEVNGIAIGPINLVYLADLGVTGGGFVNNQMFQDLGLTFTNPNSASDSPASTPRIARLRNLSPNKYDVRFRLNPQYGFDTYNPGPQPGLDQYAQFPVLVTKLEPDGSGESSWPNPPTYVAHPDGFSVTLDAYPY